MTSVNLERIRCMINTDQLPVLSIVNASARNKSENSSMSLADPFIFQLPPTNFRRPIVCLMGP